MMMTSAQAFTAVDQVASDKEIDQLLVDLLRHPSPQTERLEDDPQLKKFIAEMVAPRLWFSPNTVDGAYTSNDAKCRKYAIER